MGFQLGARSYYTTAVVSCYIEVVMYLQINLEVWKKFLGKRLRFIYHGKEAPLLAYQ